MKTNKLNVILSILITILLILFVCIKCNFCFTRFGESIVDFGKSIAFYFCKLFGIDITIDASVNNESKLDNYVSLIPNNFEVFKENLKHYFSIVFDKINFQNYCSYVLKRLFNVLYYSLILMPFLIIIVFIFKLLLKTQNNNYNADTKPLKVYKRFYDVFLDKIKQIIEGFILFVKDNEVVKLCWFIILLFGFNIISIMIEFLAFYFYFVISFDLSTIYRQVYKLTCDLKPIFTIIPKWVWFIIGFIIFDKIRRAIALKRLNHFELRNRGFINERPILTMICGTMGKKKTTTLTDIAISQEIMFRDVAFQKILENDLKFPYFPFINLENEIKNCMEYHTIWNLASCKEFIYKKYCRWVKDPVQEKIFGYDLKRYPYRYNDKLKVITIWDMLVIYAQLYFIYTITSSLLVSNYSIRVDCILNDLGNFPLWNSELFKKDAKMLDAYSRHAHIIDFDALRLGKKIIENNKYANSFEFGVFTITEIGKERGNNLELQSVKKNDNNSNQKNDLFNYTLKMCRHSATVDNYPFIKIITDEQRPESWGADARDLCEIVHIKKTNERRLAMPFFTIEEIIYNFIYSRFINFYTSFRFKRGDNCLTVYFLKSIVARMHHFYISIYNLFGYSLLNIQVESGTQDSLLDDKKYFIMSKKIYSKRFSTDCFSDFFTKKSLSSSVGINDLPEYETEKASLDELKSQNSYFINDLIKWFKK